MSEASDIYGDTAAGAVVPDDGAPRQFGSWDGRKFVPAPITRADGLTPYDVTELAPSSAHCDYCEEGAEIDHAHRHAFYVTRDGAASRTADNLCAVFLFDVEEITTWRMPADVRDLAEGIESTEWIDDPDDADYLRDVANNGAAAALADVGMYVEWDDGYVIGEIIDATAEGLEWIGAVVGADDGAAAGAWVIDGNTDRDTALRLFEGLADGDPEILDALPAREITEDAAPWWTTDNNPVGQDDYSAAFIDAYDLAFSTAVESTVMRAAVGILDGASGLLFEDWTACAHCGRAVKIEDHKDSSNYGLWVHVWSGDYYAGNRARCLDNIDNIAAPASGPVVMRFAWPGGYRIWYVTDDGAELCAECAQDNLGLIRVATRGDGWRVIGQITEAEMESAPDCDHCNRGPDADYLRELEDEVTQ